MKINIPDEIKNMSDNEARKAWFKIQFEIEVIPVMRAFWGYK